MWLAKRKAITTASRVLARGLEVEAEAFVEVFRNEDSRIGVATSSSPARHSHLPSR